MQDWREVPKGEMLTRVIVAVDSARGEAIAQGDETFPRYVENVLFPFLEAEREAASDV